MAAKKDEVFMTVAISKQLQKQLKEQADRSGMKLKRLVSKLIESGLAETTQPGRM